jgi:PPOX class probable F420-dependent enzyme
MGRQTRPVPAMSPDEQRAMVAGARVARLATLRPDGTARLVPITFVLLDGLVCSAVDEVKPKRSPRLARLDDVRRDPRAAVLVDRYSDDWAQLWWVRAEGSARVIETTAAEAATALELLAARYAHYREASPPGPLLAIDVARWSGWEASPG